MENLLHERLRKYASENDLDIYLNGTRYFIPFTNEEALALADEIERYYIPLPRFEDGQPVRPGSFVKQFGRPFEVVNVKPTFLGYSIIETKSGHVMHVMDGWPAPRPKVLDADQVETKVGDKGFNVVNGHPLEIVGIDYVGEYSVQAKYPGTTQTFHIKPEAFTHEQPIFDAEGVRICKGDEGWSDLTGKKLSPVEGFSEDAFGTRVELSDGSWIEPLNFTRQEPDSLEKLRDDIDCYMRDCALDTDTIDEFERRFTALIEKGA